MRFIKLAITTYETNHARPSIGADDIWINLDHVVSIEEHLGSNNFEEPVRAGRAVEEHYPCLQLTMSNRDNHLIPLGVYRDQSDGFEAIARFIPTLIDGSAHPRGEASSSW